MRRGVPKPAASTVTRTLPGHRRIDRRAEDDLRVGIDRAADHVGRFVDLVHRHVRAAGDVEDHAARAFDRRLEQRRGDRLLRGIGGAVLAGAFADAHHRRTRVGHDRLDVGEVEIDQARLRDQIADALRCLGAARRRRTRTLR